MDWEGGFLYEGYTVVLIELKSELFWFRLELNEEDRVFYIDLGVVLSRIDLCYLL